MDALAWFRFSKNLRGLVRRANAQGALAYAVTRRASIKDVLEAVGVPHTEVYALWENGRALTFETLLEAGMTVGVEGALSPVDVTQATPLHQRPFPRLAFAADANVGKLARLLRMLGFDTSYDPKCDDALAEQAETEKRVVLSRDKACLKRSRIVYGRWIRANDPTEQLRDVMAVFGLRAKIRPFTRCLRCNTLLVRVAKADVLAQLQPLTRQYYTKFSRCPTCERVYWAGTHHEKMLEFLDEL